MFAAVEYVGFDARPELRSLAERATAVLATEISAEYHPATAVAWRPVGQAALELSLTLALPIGTSTASGTAGAEEIRAADDADLRSRLRRVWLAVLDRLLEARKKVWDEYLREPMEV